MESDSKALARSVARERDKVLPSLPHLTTCDVCGQPIRACAEQTFNAAITDLIQMDRSAELAGGT